MDKAESLLLAAEQVMRILARHRVEAVVIGAVAMAAHHYVRFTHDIDLGVNADIPTLHALVKSFRAEGFVAELREPDGQDPLGGVIDITGSFGLLQIISFADRFPAVIEDALQATTVAIRPGSPLKLVPLPQLVALKLYAGGLKSKADVLELLKRNPETDVDDIHTACRRYRVGGLDEILRELGLSFIHKISPDKQPLAG
jgi:hypothetical protein